MSEDSKVVKASMNNETAASTERHNDRDMYEEKDERYDVSKNIHWDCYGCGSSFLAEEQFYNTNFSSVLEAQNDRYLKQRHPEKVMSMDEYHRKHMPQEMIFQIGNLQNQEQGIGIDDSWCKEAIPKVVEKLESVGCKVISYDLHNDEATPHVHLRYCPIDSKGEVNMSNCLYEHGVMPPDVSKLEYRKNGKPKFTRFNNPKQTLINEVRAKLEELGHEWCAERGLILDDQNRTKRKHQTVNEYKREQLRKDVAKLEDTIEEKQDEVEKVKAEIEKKNSDLAHVETVYTNRKANVKEALFDEMANQRNEAKAEADQIIESAKQKASEMKKREEEKNAALINENALVEKELEQKQSTSKKLDKDIKDKEEWLESRKYGIEVADKEIDEKLEFTKSIDDVTNTWKRLKQFLIQSNLLKFKMVKEAVEKFDKFFKTAAEIQREKVNRLDDYSSSQPYEDSRSFGD